MRIANSTYFKVNKPTTWGIVLCTAQKNLGMGGSFNVMNL